MTSSKSGAVFQLVDVAFVEQFCATGERREKRKRAAAVCGWKVAAEIKVSTVEEVQGMRQVAVRQVLMAAAGRRRWLHTCAADLI